ncbi:porin [Variovorax sp.]|uniref:porin n=1 Tax=Variovorax sp. TaxID=1871043 RepID=UPI0037DA21AC
MAALAVAGVASAQSSVTLFGVVDAAVSNYSTKSTYYSPLANPFLVAPVGVKQSQTALSRSGYNSSRLGFRGTEDLGGGLAASFWLEAPISNDDGSKGVADFSRRSTVSLSGGFGEVRLGRDYTSTFWNDTVFDPFGTNGVGTNLIATINSNLSTSSGPGSAVDKTDNYYRASNSIGYFLPPNLGGFYGQVQYALHENVKSSGLPESPSTRGRYVGGRFGYANGPIDVAAAYGQSTAADSVTLSNLSLITGSQDRKISTFNLGASYDFGPVKLFGEMSRVKDKNETGASSSFVNPLTLQSVPYFATTSQSDKYNGYLLGVTVPVGPGLIRASYSTVKFKNGAPLSVTEALFGGNRDASANKLAIGYVHNLSKRTALYATVARIRIKDGQNNPGVMGATAGGSPAYLDATKNIGWAPRTATGYDIGIRHAF